MVRHLSEFTRSVRMAAEGGNLNRALTMITDFVLAVLTRDGATVRVFSSPELDDICLGLGRLRPLVPQQERNPKGVVFLVTALYEIGGHSRVLKDIIAAHEKSNVTVLVTNTMQVVTQDDINRALAGTGAEGELAPPGNHATRMLWLQKKLQQLRPSRTFIMIHHFDAVCVAAAQPELVGELYFYHNGDHSLTLGAHIPHARHIDFHAKGFYNCRDQLGIRENVLWPLTVDVPQPPQNREFMRDGLVTTACCGGFEKFEQPHMIEAYPYSIAYEEVVTKTLLTTGGRHVHIGKLSEDMLNRIEIRLHRAGIPPESFVHILFAPALSEALYDSGVDIYMGSMPRGGGRATVEAMGAGMPMLIHSNYRSVFFSDENEVYPGAMIWRTLDDLADHLRKVTPVKLEDHAKKARTFFENHHTNDALSNAMKETFSGAPPSMPARPSHIPNALQAFLDEREFYGPRLGDHLLANVDQDDEGGERPRVISYPRLFRLVGTAELKPDVSHQHTRFMLDQLQLVDANTMQIHGWALSRKAITRIAIFHNNELVGDATTGMERLDVESAHPEYENDHSGFIYRWKVEANLQDQQLISAVILSLDETIGEFHRAFELISP